MKEFTLKITFLNDTGTCHDCPLCEYDGFYDRQIDSGYDCNAKDGIRIEDDYIINQWEKAKKESERLPLLQAEFTTPNPMTIPGWCPLKEIQSDT